MLASCQLLWNPTACSLVTANCLSIEMLCLAGEDKEEKTPAAKTDAKVCTHADICYVSVHVVGSVTPACLCPQHASVLGYVQWQQNASRMA